MTHVVGALFARGGSKGVPGKNLQAVAGESLVRRAVRAGLAAPSVPRMLVSSDDDAILAEAEAAGAEVPFRRPAALAADDSPELESWRHLLRWLDDAGRPCDVLVSVPATAPLRLPDDVERTVQALLADPAADLAVTTVPARAHPGFNLVRRHPDGTVSLWDGDAAATRRQDVDPAHELTTVAYAARARHVMDCDNLMAGRVVGVEVPPERGIDVDTPLDLRIARLLAEDGT